MTRLLLSLLLACALWPSAEAVGQEQDPVPDEATRAGVVRQMLDQSRLLEDAKFTIPLDYWKEFLREQAEAHGVVLPPPVPFIVEAGEYRLLAPAGHPPVLRATVRLHVFRPGAGAVASVLCSKVPGGWDSVAINGHAASLTEFDGWLHFSPGESGDYVVTATSSLKDYHAVNLSIPRSVRTVLEFESPQAMEVAVAGDPRRIRGTPGAETRGSLALSPRNKLEFTVNPRGPETEHAPTFEVRGDVAWNFDPAGQTVTAALDLAIVGGKTETIDLALSPGATRVTVTGPDVREARPGQGEGGAVRVFLRGAVAERTRLELSFQLPAAGGGIQTVGGLSVRRGHWTVGTVVCTSTGGGSEAVQDSTTGLAEIALADIPASAAARLAGPAALAYLITGRDWSAGVELLNLGEFALRESIADAAHYEVVLRDDGSMMCSARYEIRNRNKQFLRVELPAGATAVLARVNEQSRPLATVAGERDAYLLPLVRSKASLKGLVSFPVEIVAYYRVRPLAAAGDAALPLPRIDLPIAYAKCEAWLPTEMSPLKWSGVLQQVARYADESGGESFGYGHGEAAEKPTPPKVTIRGHMTGLPPPPPTSAKLNLMNMTMPAGAALDQQSPPSESNFNLGIEQTADGRRLALPQALASNYYRAGNEAYEKGDYANARQSFEQVKKLAPASLEAANSERLLSNTLVIETTQPKFDLSARMAGTQVEESATPFPATVQYPTGKEWAALTQKRMKDGAAASGEPSRPAPKPMSKSEKVAAQDVKGELQLANRKLLEDQQQFLEQGRLQIAQGNKAAALDQFRAATALGDELSNRGADKLEQDRRLRVAKDEIARADEQATRGIALKEEIRTAEKSRTTRKAVSSEVSQFALKMSDQPVPSEESKLKTSEVIGVGGGGNIFGGMPGTGTGRGGGSGSSTPAGGATVTSGTANGNIQLPAARPAEAPALKNMLIVQEGGASGGSGYFQDVPPPTTPQPPAQQVQLGTNLALQRATKGAQFVDLNGSHAALPQNLDYVIDEARTTHRVLPNDIRELDSSISEETAAKEAAKLNEVIKKRAAEKKAEAGPQAILDADFKKFVDSNYKWMRAPTQQGNVQLSNGFNTNSIQTVQTPAMTDLAQKLSQNLGQKVAVSSINLNVEPSSAAALGITFQAGANGVNYALIDEAQFRTLAQLAPAADGQKSQETIVGTDALFANGWRGNVAYAADRYNNLIVNGNNLELPHEKYLLFNNGGYLTAVRTGAMQFWKDQAAPFQFAAAPQEISVPRVGQLVKFEKTLVKPTDDIGLKTHYEWKGVVQ